jgi:hypothetical protein
MLNGGLMRSENKREVKFCRCGDVYGGPGQKYRDYSAFGQITGLCPCKLQAPSGARLAGQPVLRGVIAIFIAGLSVYPLFEFGASAGLQRLRAYPFDRVLAL